jgi:predicted oxidoreductase
MPIEGNQLEFSLTSNNVMDDGSLDDCMINKRLAMSWSPLGSYFKEDSLKTKRIKKVLKSLCNKYNATEDQLLLSWVLKHPAEVYPVVGTATPDRLEMAMKALEIEMELQDWFLLFEASNGYEVA